MGDRRLSHDTYRAVEAKAEAAGSVDHVARQRRQQGLGLHPLIDPAQGGVIRVSRSRMDPTSDGKFRLTRGVAMPVENRADTTGSMGKNVDVVFATLPTTYSLLASGSRAVLKRYDTQIATGTFQDVVDEVLATRSMFEMDEKIAEQMTMIPTDRWGGDETEDPGYSLFGGAYLTLAWIEKYGLKGYDFTFGDAPGRDRLDPDQLIRVYGESVFDKVAENGRQMDRRNLPDVRQVVSDLKKRSHAFMCLIGNSPSARTWWTKVYGEDRVVVLPRTQLLPQVQAAIIGLTEGVIDLQSVADFLRENQVALDDARVIARSLQNIPVGAQARLPNFAKIPLEGAIFASRDDIWPIGTNGTQQVAAAAAPGTADVPAPKDSMWL